jgi:hypothetical protein
MKLNQGSLSQFTLGATFAYIASQHDKIVVVRYGIPGADRTKGTKERQNK